MNDDRKKINWQRTLSSDDDIHESSSLSDNASLSSPEEAQHDIESLKKEIEQGFQTKHSSPGFQEVPQELPHQKEPDWGISPSSESPDNDEASLSKLREEVLRAQDVSSPEKKASYPGIEQTYYTDLSEAMESSQPATMAELIKRSRFEEEEKKVLSPRSRKNILFIIGTLVFLIASIGILSLIFKNARTPKVEIIEGQKVSSLVYADTNTGINLTGIDTARTKQAIRQVVERKHSKESIDQIYYVEQDSAGNLRRLGIKDVFAKTDAQVPPLLYDNIENTFMHGVYTSDKNYPFLVLKALSYDRAYLGMKEWEPTMIDDLSPFFDLPDEANDRSLLSPGFEDDLIKNKNARVARFLPRSTDRQGILDFLKNIGNSLTGSQSTETPSGASEVSESSLENQESSSGSSSWFSDDGTVGEETTALLTPVGSLLRSLTQAPSVFAQSQRTVYGRITDTDGIGILDIPVSVKNNSSIGDRTDGDGNYSFGASVQSFILVAGGADGSGNVYEVKEIAVPAGQTMPLNIQLASEVVGLNEAVITNGQCTNGQIVCYNNSYPGQVFDKTYEGQPGYYCIDIVGGNCQVGTAGNGQTGGETEIGQISYTAPICFDPISGERLMAEQQEVLGDVNNPYGFCFDSYRCYKYVCIDERTNLEVSSIREGEPGIVCRQSTQIVPYDFEGKKFCQQFTDLLSMNNINQQTLCFDKSGTYLPYITNEEGSMQGVTCISPHTRSDRMCITQEGQLVNPDDPDAPIYENYKFCFEPLNGVTTTIDVNDKCGELTVQEIQQRMAQAAFEIRFLANLGAVLGLSDSFIQTLNETAAFLNQLAQGNVVQIEETRQILSLLHDIEEFLDEIDPNLEMPQEGPSGNLNFYGTLRYIIDLVKCSLGIANTLQWSTLDPIPQGITIYAGQSVPGMIPIQQSLVLLGLMDPVSVSGTLDLITQDAISQFQLANALQVTGVIDSPTLELLQTIIEGSGSIIGNEAIINNYFGAGGELGGTNTVGGVGTLGEGQITLAQGLGSYGTIVQNLQVILFGEGYLISHINGIFDEETCQALQAYQEDNGLEVADPVTCVISDETYDSLNNLIREKGYLGSGFVLNPQGYLEGKGNLEGRFGPGVRDYIAEASGDSLNQGDVVLLYTFLDENTILIARDEVVINEIIKRRALYDIFNK